MHPRAAAPPLQTPAGCTVDQTRRYLYQNDYCFVPGTPRFSQLSRISKDSRASTRSCSTSSNACSIMNLDCTYDVGPSTQGVQRGLERKDPRDLKDLTIHNVQDTQLTKPGSIGTRAPTGFEPGEGLDSVNRDEFSETQMLCFLKRLQDTQLTKPVGSCTRTTSDLYQEPPDSVNCHASRKISKTNKSSRRSKTFFYTDARFDGGFNTCRYLQGATVCNPAGSY